MGCISAVVGTPAEVAQVLMITDGRLPPTERRGYTSVLDARERVTLEERLLNLSCGTGPTVARALVLRGGQLRMFHEAKQRTASNFGISEGVELYGMASAISVFACTVASIP